MSANKQTRHRKPHKPRSDFQRLSRRFMSGFLRSLLLINKPARAGQAGFVLPTTVLLLLVMTLTVGALSFRTASRTQATFLAREQQVIDNVAAPAVDRAKSKLEYLFTRDTRLPGSGTPSSDMLAILMRNVTSTGVGGVGVSALGTDPYNLPDEERIDINNDGTVDNAWSFSFDLNGNGTADTGEIIAYSILMDDAVDLNATPTPRNRNDDVKLEDTGTANTILKANNLVTRNGPINTDETLANCGGSREPEQGWLPISSSTVEKNFQITAYVSNGKDIGRSNSALELQQVRRASKGNRWGAWFKYDVELHPGPIFNWNGAIHSDGNIMMTDDFRAHMISGHKSCLYTKEASQLTMAERDNDGDGDIEVATGDFQGQLIMGAPGRGNYGVTDTTDIHIFTTPNAKPSIMTTNTKLTESNDSVTNKSALLTLTTPIEVATDPFVLFTRGISQHRTTSNWKRDPNWSTGKHFTGGRVLNQNVRSPYLDDFSRADNRYGPNPSYGNTKWVTATDDGTDRSAVANRGLATYDKSLGEEIISTDPDSNNLLNETAGLDGYWERQTIANGMRIVVGQRLELGDTKGWNFNASTGAVGTNTDPIYPPNNLGSTANKQKQRVTLRDNLAAVQGMVVYHYEGLSGSSTITDGQYPLACVANTAHAGTFATLNASRDFRSETFKDSATPTANDITLISNFLSGKGTNGWEYDFPTTFKPSAAGAGESFGTALAANKPLGIALRNLARFAGDPKGGAPSFKPVQDSVVHPFPQMAMWGDYSVLRRIFDERLDATGWNASTTSMADRYAKLSPADKSSLHSAACTMGLLGKNLTMLSQISWIPTISSATSPFPSFSNPSGNVSQGKVITEVGKPVWDALGIANNGSFPTTSLASKYCMEILPAVAPGKKYNCKSPSKEEIIAAAGSTLTSDAQAFINLLSDFTQVQRDRTYGFQNSPVSTTYGVFPISVGNDTFNMQFPDACHPLNALGAIRPLFNSNPLAPGQSSFNAGVALACATQPKYPSLHYLFPIANHDHNDGQPTGEEYITSSNTPSATAKYIFDDTVPSSPTGVNSAVTYKVVGDDNTDGVQTSAELGMSAIAFNYRTTFQLPRTDTAVASGGVLNPESMQIIDMDGTLVNVPLLDKVMYNGREEMAVRVLDIDLKTLTQDNNVSDYWISDAKESLSGLLYAAREDAVREDAIVRPAVDTWANCNNLTKLMSAACRMNTGSGTGATPKDPPLSRRTDGSLVGISLKPVDFAPDPDRRPYGFRLNAALNGNKGDLSNNKSRNWGFTFVTDNAAYIKGEFNPHTTTGADTIEEFTETLLNNDIAYEDEFYDLRLNLNTSQFATRTVDRWRVAEILADGISVLSERSVDGSVEEGFIRNQTQVSTNFKNTAPTPAFSLTSFHNQQRPLDGANAWGNASQWRRINGKVSAVAADQNLPIWVGRNGESETKIGTTVKPFNDAESTDFELPDERDEDAIIKVPIALAPRVNATFISGIVPSRNNQGYGGLHNFPRLLEDWQPNGPDPANDPTDLFIQGAFLQLNFSTASTAPFDADAWDPDDAASTTVQRINYYKPAGRRWGYDVALQYTPAGPIAQRFVTLERPRSEHYRELPIEDPYVVNLRCSERLNGTRIFPNESCSP
jgi:hypothetical protein